MNGADPLALHISTLSVTITVGVGTWESVGDADDMPDATGEGAESIEEEGPQPNKTSV